jgi:hypothetical protein
MGAFAEINERAGERSQETEIGLPQFAPLEFRGFAVLLNLRIADRQFLNAVKKAHLSGYYSFVPLTPMVAHVTSTTMQAEKNSALNVRVVPEELIRKAKSSAALQGKTLREWIIEAIQEKLKRTK